MNETQLIKVVTPKCFSCGERSVVEVSAAGHERWIAGTLIQEAFPEMTSDERELLKSGIHPACWNKMFG